MSLTCTKNNIKQTWKTITETLNKQVNSREIPTKIIHNDETLTDNENIADCFNSYFANIEYHHLKLI